MTTGTEPIEELEVPHLKERLWHELAELHPEHRAPGDELVRRRARRSLRRTSIAAAAAAALIAGVLATQIIDDDTPLTERVAAATDEALAESVVHRVEEQVSPNGERRRFEQWWDETTGVARFLDQDEQGNSVMDVGSLTGPTLESSASAGQRVVDYCTQTYVDHLDTGGASINLPPGIPDIRTQVADGELVEDGTEVVDGRELIRLRGTDSEGGDFVLLVDPDTYRVVGLRGRFDGGARETYTTVYEYLPRTAESLELLVPPIPDGFTQVEPGEGPAAGTSCP